MRLMPCLLALCLAAAGTSCSSSGGRLFSRGAGSTADRIPPGYRLVYTQTFDQPASLKDFVFTDPAAWTFGSETNGGSLELKQQSKYEPPFRSPLNIALLDKWLFGDFVLEADFLQTGREYGHRDMCIFFGVRNPSNFYYTHVATQADPNAHNVFIVKDAPRSNFATKTTSGVNWGLNVWHRIRLERTVADGAIRVYFDDFTTPIMIAEERSFIAGHIGFGSFDDTGKIDNIKIWARNPEKRPSNLFKPRP